jgi:hypothetical protein
MSWLGFLINVFRDTEIFPVESECLDNEKNTNEPVDPVIV